MRNPPFDPAAVQVEDQRGTVPDQETVFDIVRRVTANNYRRDGIAGVFGLQRVFPSIVQPARTLDGKTYTLDPAKIARMPVHPPVPRRTR